MNETRDQHVVIIGSGRVGTGLASRLVERDYSVAVVDSDERAFRRIREPSVERITGVGYDRDTLLRAGIERAVGLAAVTNGDNTNIVVARTAHELFGVPHVLARIYDVRRAAIYERLGVPTVASALLTIEMSLHQLIPDDDAVHWIDSSARVCVVERPAPRSMAGRSMTAIERDGELRVVAVRRLGASVVPTSDLVIQEGDVLYAAVAADHLETLDADVFDRAAGSAS